nr:isoform 2 of wd repeat-containing protein 7 [Quercus suber]
MVRTLPSNGRYVCIGCSFVDTVHVSGHHSTDPAEGGEGSVDRVSQQRKPPKCTVVVVDTYTLTIVQTVFHGNLSIGSLKFMAVVPPTEHREKHSVVMGDLSGRLQLVSILKDPHRDGEVGTGSHKSSSQSGMTVWADELSEGGQVLSIATCGDVIAFVLQNRCVFRLLASGTTIGEISFEDNFICLESKSAQSHVIGGMFLESEDFGSELNNDELNELFSKKFSVWNNKGFAVVYTISFSNSIFKSELLCEIPSTSHPHDVRLSVCLIQLNCYLLRIDSLCFGVEEPLQWKPHITIWSPHSEHDDHGKLCLQCRMLGESSFFVDWIANFTLLQEIEGPTGWKNELSSKQSSDPSSTSVNNIHEDDYNYGCVHKGQIVSSSMVISENLFAPYGIVYGFFSGEIEVVRLDLFHGLTSHGNSPRCAVSSHVSRQYFLGHTGAVLCLAAHRMVGTSKGWSFNQVLVSGGMDCTVRIWDLDTGNIITVMHQHVAPVCQIILPPSRTDLPWSDCFLSVGEDSCVALASLETLRVERIFPGHPSCPAKVVWDGVRGYIACLCRNHSGTSDANDVLYIWDVKSGARERVLRGTASHSMFDHFCKGISLNSLYGTVLNGNTSVSLLNLPIIDDGSFSPSNLNNKEKLVTLSNVVPGITNIIEPNTSQANVSKGISVKPYLSTQSILQSIKPSIKCYCPFPGISTLIFDLGLLMFPCQRRESTANGNDKADSTNVKEKVTERPSPRHINIDDGSDMHGSMTDSMEELDWIRSLEECLLRFSLSFLHLWNVDCELDNLLITDMKLKRPENLIVASGLLGDKGSLTLTFPGLSSILELWKSSSEFCAMRSLTIVSLAQRMISLSHSGSTASSALAAFYTRNFAERYPDLKPPLLQLLVSFWQDESEHVRMAARSLFHRAVSRAIPLPLRSQKATDQLLETQGISQVEESKILAWLESFEMQDWISCVGGTSQDAMTSHIIVAAALSIWYPSLVKPNLAMLVVHPLVKLVMAMNGKYSSTAAELLAEGMESTWKACLGSEIPRLVGDIFFQIECVSGPSANSAAQNLVIPVAIRETLVEILLPSLALADIPGFLNFIESQVWSTASDSPVHLVSLMTLIRVIRGSPRSLAQYLDKICRWLTSFYKLWTLAILSCVKLAFKVQ